MEIQRDIMHDLLEWKRRPGRKPLIIRGARLSGKSLGSYIKKYSPELAIRYSMNNLKKDGAILNIPLFLADWTEQLLQCLR